MIHRIRLLRSIGQFDSVAAAATIILGRLEIPGAVVVRFRRASTLDQQPIALDLTARQRAVLDVLNPGELVTVSEILSGWGARIRSGPFSWTWPP